MTHSEQLNSYVETLIHVADANQITCVFHLESSLIEIKQGGDLVANFPGDGGRVFVEKATELTDAAQPYDFESCLKAQAVHTLVRLAS